MIYRKKRKEVGKGKKVRAHKINIPTSRELGRMSRKLEYLMPKKSVRRFRKKATLKPKILNNPSNCG